MSRIKAWHGGFAAALVLAAISVARFGQGAQVPAYAAGDDARAGAFQISVNVDLVVLNAVVTDRKGRFAPDLRAGDFAVYEDGVRQTLQLFRHEDIPAAVGLVIDHSGSMRGKLADVIAAARTFVQSSSPDDQMLVVNFSDTVSLGLRAPIRLSNQPDELAAAILRTPVAGQTALYDAMFRAFDEVRTADRDKKVLVVFSDGGDNVSKHTLSEVLTVAEQSSTLVYAIGIFDESDPDQNPGVLRRLSRATGGEAFFPAGIDGVAAIYARIASDIRNQYTLGYVSRAPRKTGTHRNIRVTAASARESKLTVRTRTGYVVGGEK